MTVLTHRIGGTLSAEGKWEMRTRRQCVGILLRSPTINKGEDEAKGERRWTVLARGEKMFFSELWLFTMKRLQLV